jgi:dTDP-glucose 4,6-dehydratase
LYVEDRAKALTLVLVRGRSRGTYNIGAREERTNIDVVRKICDLLDHMEPARTGSRHRLIAFVRNWRGHDRRYAIDPAGQRLRLLRIRDPPARRR